MELWSVLKELANRLSASPSNDGVVDISGCNHLGQRKIVCKESNPLKLKPTSNLCSKLKCKSSSDERRGGRVSRSLDHNHRICPVAIKFPWPGMFFFFQDSSGKILVPAIAKSDLSVQPCWTFSWHWGNMVEDSSGGAGWLPGLCCWVSCIIWVDAMASAAWWTWCRYEVFLQNRVSFLAFHKRHKKVNMLGTEACGRFMLIRAKTISATELWGCARRSDFIYQGCPNQAALEELQRINNSDGRIISPS